MRPTNETQLWITTQRETAPVIEAFYRDNYSEQAIMQFKLKYRQSCDRAFDNVMSNPKLETLEVQLSIVCSPYIDNEESRLAMEVATLKFFRNRLTVESKQSEDIFNVVYKKLEDLNIYPDENAVLQAWEVDENGKRIGHIESDILGSSYVWLGNNVTDDLNKLFLALKKNRFISDETDSVTFLSAFNGVEISTIEKKIKWIGTKNLCVYFIYQLLQKKLVEEEKMWSQLEKLFLDKTGEPMKGGAIIKNKIVSVEIEPPHGSRKIDSILSKIIDF
ncbi:hypothetical protein N9C07_07575 [Flavobacteriaceae bacterium]|nr:hypothetical protein [Flavobacteriaceae bacterium]MDC1543144.1 hypothetical protein [Flavobacteriaceae bacterium]